MAIITGPGLVFWGFSVTFMAVDWVLSLDPHWFSTMFGLLFMAGQGLSSMAFLITVLVHAFLPPPDVATSSPRATCTISASCCWPASWSGLISRFPSS